MKIISCASYYGTGSSAITDYLSEFDNVYSMSNEEFSFLHDPEGVSDLEYNLVENHHRLNSGRALKRYKRLVDFRNGNCLLKRYRPHFHGQWRAISYQYIESLTDFQFRGWWCYDIYDHNAWFYFRKRLLNKLLHLTFWRNKPERDVNSLPNEITYCSRPSEERFLACTRAYVDALMAAANTQNKPIVCCDQLVPPSNLARYLRYVNDLQVVIVERDPRDLYLLSKHRWNDSIIPTHDAETFCKWFDYTRAHRKSERFDAARIMLIQFEDFVYHYDETAARLNAFLSLDETQHIHPKSAFNPAVSINNTRLWKEYPQEADAIRYIETHLAEYLYPDERAVPANASRT